MMQEVCLIQTKQKQGVPSNFHIHKNMHKFRLTWESAHQRKGFLPFYILGGIRIELQY